MFILMTALSVEEIEFEFIQQLLTLLQLNILNSKLMTLYKVQLNDSISQNKLQVEKV